MPSSAPGPVTHGPPDSKAIHWCILLEAGIDRVLPEHFDALQRNGVTLLRKAENFFAKRSGTAIIVSSSLDVYARFNRQNTPTEDTQAPDDVFGYSAAATALIGLRVISVCLREDCHRYDWLMERSHPIEALVPASPEMNASCLVL